MKFYQVQTLTVTEKSTDGKCINIALITIQKSNDIETR